MFLGDASCARFIDAGVPDIFGIYHHHWPVAALIHAARVIDPHLTLKPGSSGALLQNGMNRGGPVERARLSARADEHVVAVLSHHNKLGPFAARRQSRADKRESR